MALTGSAPIGSLPLAGMPPDAFSLALDAGSFALTGIVECVLRGTGQCSHAIRRACHVGRCGKFLAYRHGCHAIGRASAFRRCG